jgi:hypothetical protein
MREVGVGSHLCLSESSATFFCVYHHILRVNLQKVTSFNFERTKTTCSIPLRFSLLSDPRGRPTVVVPIEMEIRSRGPTFGDFVTILTEASMQDVTVTRLQSTRVQTLLSLLF